MLTKELMVIFDLGFSLHMIKEIIVWKVYRLANEKFRHFRNK